MKGTMVRLDLSKGVGNAGKLTICCFHDPLPIMAMVLQRSIPAALESLLSDDLHHVTICVQLEKDINKP